MPKWIKCPPVNPAETVSTANAPMLILDEAPTLVIRGAIEELQRVAHLLRLHGVKAHGSNV